MCEHLQTLGLFVSCWVFFSLVSPGISWSELFLLSSMKRGIKKKCILDPFWSNSSRSAPCEFFKNPEMPSLYRICCTWWYKNRKSGLMWNKIHSQHMGECKERLGVAYWESDRQSASRFSVLSPPLVWHPHKIGPSPLCCSWRVKSLTCSRNFFSFSPAQKCSRRPHPNTVLCLFICPSSLHSSLPFLFHQLRRPPAAPPRRPFLCVLLWNGALLHHTALLARSLFHSSFFFVPHSLPLSLSGWELIWEAQLPVDCPQRTPGHNRRNKKNKERKKTLRPMWRLLGVTLFMLSTETL